MVEKEIMKEIYQILDNNFGVDKPRIKDDIRGSHNLALSEEDVYELIRGVEKRFHIERINSYELEGIVTLKDLVVYISLKIIEVPMHKHLSILDKVIGFFQRIYFGG